jgi:hypothetical protein
LSEDKGVGSRVATPKQTKNKSKKQKIDSKYWVAELKNLPTYDIITEKKRNNCIHLSLFSAPEEYKKHNHTVHNVRGQPPVFVYIGNVEGVL